MCNGLPNMLSFFLEHCNVRQSIRSHCTSQPDPVSPGDVSGARRDAESIARFLKDRFGAEVWGIGSLFEELRPFRKGSDIDLVAKGISTDRFFEVLAEVQDQTQFPVDLIPWEEANDLIREILLTSGVRL